MDDRRGEGAFYSLPEGTWDDIDARICTEVWRLNAQLAATVEWVQAIRPGLLPPQEQTDDAPEASVTGQVLTPAQLSVRFYNLANQLWAAVSDQETDLRQVITTLRTALATCWDLYSPQEAQKTTVAVHMQSLQRTIEDFQRDLSALQAERSAGAVEKQQETEKRVTGRSSESA